MIDDSGPPRVEALLRETFTQSFHHPTGEQVWDVQRARDIIASAPREPVVVDPTWLQDWVSDKESYIAEHVDHVPPDKRDVPGILVRIYHAERLGGALEWMPILIDGTHRAARALREGRLFFAYELTEDEQHAISTYSGLGRIPGLRGLLQWGPLVVVAMIVLAVIALGLHLLGVI